MQRGSHLSATVNRNDNDMILIGFLAIVSILGLSFLSVMANAEEIKPDIKTNIKQFYQDYVQQKKTPPTNELPRFVNMGDIYIGTHRPTHVQFHVIAVDYQGHDIKVECDKYPGQLFPVGRTRVHCMAVDELGNEVRGSFFITVGYEVVEIPFWIRDITGYWVQDKINNAEYFQTITYLLNHDIIVIPNTTPDKAFHDNTNLLMPSWIKKHSELFSINKTGNHEFSIVISWLIENGFIRSN